MALFFALLFAISWMPQSDPLPIIAASAGVLGLAVLLLIRHPSVRLDIPKPQGYLAIASMIGIIVASLYAAVPTETIPGTIRTLEAWVIYVIFSRYAKQIPSFATAFRAFIYICIGIVLLSLYAGIPTRFSLMTAFTGANGHHPIAYFLVGFLPLAIVTPWGTALSLVGIGVSGARSAMGITLLFLIYSAIKNHIRDYGFFWLTAIGILVSLLSAAYWIRNVPEPQRSAITDRIPNARFYVKDLNSGIRMEFLKQGISAIRISPLTGFGPESFPLTSRRFQSRPGTFSSYAHSYPVQVVAENGLIGGIPMLLAIIFVIATAIRTMRDKHDRTHTALSWSLVLLAAYSVFEGVFSNIPVWILFWSMAGLITGRTKRVLQIHRAVAIAIATILLGYSLGYGTSLISSRLGLVRHAVSLAPYRRDAVLRLFERQHTIPYSPLIAYAYRNDPDILIAMAKAWPDHQNEYITRALFLDPKNTSLLREYLARLIERRDVTRAVLILCDAIHSYHIIPSEILCSDSSVGSAPVHFVEGFDRALPYLVGNDGLPKFLYFLGLSLSDDPKMRPVTLTLWTTSKTLAPHWSFYHLELASAYRYWFNDEDQVSRTLDRCTEDESAGAYCVLSRHDRATLPAPGGYADDIAAIPRLLTE